MKKIILSCLIILLGSINLFAQSKKVVYSSNQSGNGYLQIFTMDEDGTGKKQVLTMDANCVNPKWSHDGSKIVFATTDEQIYVVDDIETGDYRFMWKGNAPSFSSDDSEIIFVSDYEGVNSIYIIGLSDPEPYMLSDGYYSNQAVLSNDGNYLIYSAFSDGGKSVMMRDLNDTTEYSIRKISLNKDANLEPDISPDNRKCTYAAFDMNLNGTIYLYENGSEKAITKDIPSCNQPKFSPDGSKIAFAVIKGERVKLYVMNSDGSNKKDLEVKGGDLGVFKWMDNNRIVYDAENQSEQYSIGTVNINSGDNKIIASTGFNLHPDISNK